MDYVKFVKGIQENNETLINEYIPIITGVLIKFLKVRHGADHHDAEDVVQNTIINVTEKIRKDKLNHPDTIIFYFFTTAKNEYFKFLKQKKENTDPDSVEKHGKEGDQLHSLLIQEKQKILEKCMEGLTPESKDYITYWFDHPRDDASVVAEHFGISVNNAWTKKHRIIKILKNCVEKKWHN